MFTRVSLVSRRALFNVLLCVLGILLLYAGWVFHLENVAEANLTLPISDPPQIEESKTDLSQSPIQVTSPDHAKLTSSDPIKSDESMNLPISTSSGEKNVYLTFDDGPDPVNTPQVLKILREHQVKATFFIIGMQAEKYGSIVNEAFHDGHAIGSHSYNHDYTELYRSAEAYMAQLHRTNEIICQATGIRPKISRAPGGTTGNFTNSYWKLLKKQGYVDIGWNVSSIDTAPIPAKQILNNVAEQIAAKNFLWSHAIVLMHDGPGHAETVKALPDILRFFKHNGFQFRVVDGDTPSAW